MHSRFFLSTVGFCLLMQVSCVCHPLQHLCFSLYSSSLSVFLCMFLLAHLHGGHNFIFLMLSSSISFFYRSVSSMRVCPCFLSAEKVFDWLWFFSLSYHHLSCSFHASKSIRTFPKSLVLLSEARHILILATISCCFRMSINIFKSKLGSCNLSSDH